MRGLTDKGRRARLSLALRLVPPPPHSARAGKHARTLVRNREEAEDQAEQGLRLQHAPVSEEDQGVDHGLARGGGHDRGGGFEKGHELRGDEGAFLCVLVGG